jgi:hypothetical protein
MILDIRPRGLATSSVNVNNCRSVGIGVSWIVNCRWTHVEQYLRTILCTLGCRFVYDIRKFAVSPKLSWFSHSITRQLHRGFTQCMVTTCWCRELTSTRQRSRSYRTGMLPSNESIDKRYVTSNPSSEQVNRQSMVGEGGRTPTQLAIHSFQLNDRTLMNYFAQRLYMCLTNLLFENDGGYDAVNCVESIRLYFFK